MRNVDKYLTEILAQEECADIKKLRTGNRKCIPDCDECIKANKEWLEAEYVEPEIDWSKVPMGTPVRVWNNIDKKYEKTFIHTKGVEKMIANYIEHGFEIRAKIMPNACTECPFYAYNINDDKAMCGITGTEIKTDGAQDCKRTSDCPIIKAQPTVNEWIPVERALPENDERMLVVLINGTRYKYKIIARHCGDNEWVDDNWDDVDGVVAWMPISTYEVNND